MDFFKSLFHMSYYSMKSCKLNVRHVTWRIFAYGTLCNVSNAFLVHVGAVCKNACGLIVYFVFGTSRLARELQEGTCGCQDGSRGPPRTSWQRDSLLDPIFSWKWIFITYHGIQFFQSPCTLKRKRRHTFFWNFKHSLKIISVLYKNAVLKVR